MNRGLRSPTTLEVDDFCIKARIPETIVWFFELIFQEATQRVISQQWDIPTWSSDGDYDCLSGSIDFNVWRWEFLRRNMLYRAFWLYQTEESFNFKTKTFIGYETARVILLRIFGLNNFPDPNFSIDYFLNNESKNPNWANNPTFKILSHDTISFSDDSDDDFIYKDIDLLRDRLERHSQHTIYIAINPNIDLAKQLAKAEKLLKNDDDIISTRRKISVDQPATRRNTQPKWQRYLRLLDAREAGASWAQMAVLLDPGKKDPSQAARNAWNSAVEIRRRLCCLD